MVIARLTVQPPTELKEKSDEFKVTLAELDSTIKAKFNDDWDWKNSTDKMLPLLFDHDDPDELINDTGGLDLDDLPSRQIKPKEEDTQPQRWI